MSINEGTGTQAPAVTHTDWYNHRDSIPTLDEITEEKTRLYNTHLEREPGEESEYWDRELLTGAYGAGQDWKEWLKDGVLGSEEFKTGGQPFTPRQKEYLDELKSSGSSGGGGRYKGPSLDDFRTMLNEMFSNPWTPVGFGWGGTNSDAVRINRSQGSRRGSSYSGNKSSFNRSGSRLNQDVNWMNTLGM